jgi:hypothetical protein
MLDLLAGLMSGSPSSSVFDIAGVASKRSPAQAGAVSGFGSEAAPQPKARKIQKCTKNR